jgi:hypothetical protein
MRLCVLCWALLATPAVAQKISVLDFSGSKASAVRQQLLTALCADAECISPEKVSTKGKVDWQKADRASVQAILVGHVDTKRRKRQLALEVLLPGGAQSRKRVFKLGPNGLSAAAVEQIRGAVLGAALPETSTEEDADDEVPAEPPPRAKQPAPRPAQPPQVEPARARAEPSVVDAPQSRPAATTRVPLLAVELFGDFLNKDFRYLGLMSNLRQYALPLMPMLGGRLEVYPLSRLTQGVLAGLGLEASISVAPWLRSRIENTEVAYPTSTVRFDAGLAWRILPLRDSSLALVPLVGLRLHSFVVSPAADMTRLGELPNVDYVGLRVGLGFDIGLLENLLVLFAKFQVVPVFSSGEILSAAFFSRGSNFGLDGTVGVGITLFKYFQLRAAFQFTRYGLSFRTEPTDTLIAAGAVDQYLGGTVALRFQY